MTARPRPWAIPPSICPRAARGFSTLPTSCAVATCTTFTRPRSGSTSTTARWATKANATWQLPWPFSSSSSVLRWWCSNVSSNESPRVASATETRSEPIVSTTSVPSIARRIGSRPCCLATASNIRSRTSRQAPSTAPPLIHVCREADVLPALPIAVEIGSSRTVSTPRTVRAICCARTTKPCPTSAVAN